MLDKYPFPLGAFAANSYVLAAIAAANRKLGCFTNKDSILSPIVSVEVDAPDDLPMPRKAGHLIDGLPDRAGSFVRAIGFKGMFSHARSACGRSPRSFVRPAVPALL